MLELNFTPFPVLETKRLQLREISSADIENFFEMRSSPDAMKYIGKPLHATIEDTQKFFKIIAEGIKNNEAICWAICLKNEPGLIGSISFHIIQKEHHRAEIGYMLRPKFWNKGITSEAIEKVIDFGFTKMSLHSIEASIDPANKISAKILSNAGFIKEAYFKENYFFEGKFIDTEIYSLLSK